MAKARDLFERALALHLEGRLNEAGPLYQAVLAQEPDHVGAHHNLGALAGQLGQWEPALVHLRRAAALAPEIAQHHLSLIDALVRVGLADEAVAALARSHGLPETSEAGLTAALEPAILAALAVARGRALLDHGDPGAAEAALRPHFAANAEAAYYRGLALRELGRASEAAASFRAAIAARPDLVEAHYALGGVLADVGRQAEALDSFAAALALHPDFVEAHTNLGTALQQLGRLPEAEQSFRRALAIRPDHAAAWNNLGAALNQMGRPLEAEPCFVEAERLNPAFADAIANLGSARLDLGRYGEAVADYRRAIALRPHFLKARSNLLLALAVMDQSGGPEILAEAKALGAAAAALAGPIAPHVNDRDPDRVLRIGILSPSLTRHVLAPYLQPLLRHHRRDRVSIHVYAQVANPDQVTWEMKALSDSWTFVHGLTDREAAERIRGDAIDILVDPMGHWAGNRLGVFALKPAPIQVSYLCQGLTTGLETMDYAIGDRWLNIGGAMAAFATETVVELEGGFQVTSFKDEPAIADPPMIANGFPTFGSFNNPTKISERTLALWSAVLRRLPSARMLVKGRFLEQEPCRRRLLARFEAHGVAPERLDLAGFAAEGDHMSWHNRVDVALDTLPFCGGRTTVDALWMGTPVVTRIGETAVGRFSHSHLARIGHSELAAADDEGFVALAVELAGDAARLRAYASDLRPAMKASSLFDAARHAAELEDAYAWMWRRWLDAEACRRPR